MAFGGIRGIPKWKEEKVDNRGKENK